MASKIKLSRMSQTAVVYYSLHADICCAGAITIGSEGRFGERGSVVRRSSKSGLGSDTMSIDTNRSELAHLCPVSVSKSLVDLSVLAAETGTAKATHGREGNSPASHGDASCD